MPREYVNKSWRTSNQDGDIGRYTLPPHRTKRRTTTNIKTKKQPELLENRTVWKSNNQGVKEKTLIQTSRRGRDRQLGWTGLTARWQLEDRGGQRLAKQAVPYLCADKLGGTTRERDRPHNLGFQRGEIKPQNL